MIKLVDPNDSRAVRNIDNVLALYDLMINQKKSEEGTAKFVSPAYIQHDCRWLGRAGKILRSGYARTRQSPRCRPPHHRRRRLCLGAREFSESVQRRSGGYWGRRSRHLQVGRRRKSDRALGHAAVGRRSAKLGPVGRAECTPRPFKRDVLNRCANDEQSHRGHADWKRSALMERVFMRVGLLPCSSPVLAHNADSHDAPKLTRSVVERTWSLRTDPALIAPSLPFHSKRTSTCNPRSGHPLRSAYMRSVIAVHAPNAEHNNA